MEEQQSSSPAEQKSNLNPLLIVVIVIIVGAVGVMLWLGNSKQNPTQQQTQVESSQTQTQEQTTPAATEGAMQNEDAMATAITVEGGAFYFKPNEIRVKQGQKVTVTLTNAGGMHDFVIDELNVKSEMIDGAGSTTTVEFTPDKKGTFEFYCSVGNHRQMGMKGTLIVE
jgi:cytochrome c oxidase subunit 2